MASNFKLSTLARNRVADAVATYIESNGGHGRVMIFTGSPPTNVSDASTGTLLATSSFANGWYAASNGTVLADGPQSATAVASGDAGYFRVYRNAESGASVAVMQGTCGESADTPDMVFNEKTVVIGCSVTPDPFQFTCPI